MIERRTSGVTLLALVVLFFAAANLARSFQAVLKWQFLSELLPIWPGYMVVSGLVWFVVGVWLFWRLWHGPSMGKLLPVIIGIYSIFFWLEKFWLVITGIAGTADNNWPFVVLANVFVLGWSVWELYRAAIMERIEERYERQSED